MRVRRFGREPGVEGAEIAARIGGEVERHAALGAKELRRRADPGAGPGIGDRLEAGGRAGLVRGRQQRLELAGGEDAVAGRLLAGLERDDRVAGALAEIAVARAVVEPEPDERILRGDAGRGRQRQKGRLLRFEGGVGLGRGGLRRRGLRLRLRERRAKKQAGRCEGEAEGRSAHDCPPKAPVRPAAPAMLQEVGVRRNSIVVRRAGRCRP